MTTDFEMGCLYREAGGQLKTAETKAGIENFRKRDMETKKKYINEITGNTDASWLDAENGDRAVICGECGEKQKIFLTKTTGFVEEIDFICCKCGERNTLSAY